MAGICHTDLHFRPLAVQDIVAIQYTTLQREERLHQAGPGKGNGIYLDLSPDTGWGSRVF